MNIAQNETILDNILKDAKSEILSIAKIYQYGNVEFKVKIINGEIIPIYHIDTKRSRKL